VRAPAEKFTALLENDQLTGYPEKNADTILASHWPTNSWLAETFCFDWDAIHLAIEIASINQTKAIVIAVVISHMALSISNAGKANPGSHDGISHITLQPRVLNLI